MINKFWCVFLCLTV